VRGAAIRKGFGNPGKDFAEQRFGPSAKNRAAGADPASQLSHSGRRGRPANRRLPRPGTLAELRGVLAAPHAPIAHAHQAKARHQIPPLDRSSRYVCAIILPTPALRRSCHGAFFGLQDNSPADWVSHSEPGVEPSGDIALTGVPVSRTQPPVRCSELPWHFAPAMGDASRRFIYLRCGSLKWYVRASRSLVLGALASKGCI
jgi:hypothetical protein